MGEIYRARDTRLDRTVAIKVLSEHLSSNPQLHERFDREAKAISIRAKGGGFFRRDVQEKLVRGFRHYGLI